MYGQLGSTAVCYCLQWPATEEKADSGLLKRRQHYENPRTYILDSIGEINLLITDNNIFFSEESVLLLS